MKQSDLFKGVESAREKLRDVVLHTPLMKNNSLSSRFGAEVLLKREDLQIVRSYKIRGAYNKICSLTEAELKKGVVCASAGNHAQGVAFACNKLHIKGTVFMPSPTPDQKVKQVRMFGKTNIEVILTGDTFDDSYEEAMKFCTANDNVFIHPFDDIHVIQGQGTVALEILEDIKEKIDYLFIPVGGGGLASGIATVFKKLSPETKLIGVEPLGAPSLKTSMEKGQNTTLNEIDKFVDGASVKRVGELTFEICKKALDDVILVPEGQVCSTILKLYNEDAIVVEPAGALTIASLDLYKEKIKGKRVACIVSGSNNDITRMEDIKERSLLYEGLKHYFILRFPQRAGALREFLTGVLGDNDDITHFEYSKKNNRERGPALIGLEFQKKEDYYTLIKKMEKNKIAYEYLNDKPDLFQYLI